jgi:hypothetical protein
MRVFGAHEEYAPCAPIRFAATLTLVPPSPFRVRSHIVTELTLAILSVVTVVVALAPLTS